MPSRKPNTVQMPACIAFLLILLAINSSISYAQTNNRLSRQVDSLIQLRSPKKFNGVVLIARGGEVLYQKAYGLADLEKKTPLTMKTQFGAGSVSKQFTAVLVLQEMEKGHLRLDDPIKKYLPGLKRSWADSVTIRQLLQHTSGLIRTDTTLAFAPGTACLYSNIGYQLLGNIVERTAHKPFCELTAELFRKCGMLQTTDPVLCRGNAQALANGYTMREGKPVRTDSMIAWLRMTGSASGGIISTAGDLVRWNECLHGGKLLRDSTYRLMMQPSGKIRQHSVFGEISYGFGLPFSLHSNVTEICHSGLVGGSGFYCLDFYYPDSKTSIVVMENIADENIPIKNMFFYETAIAHVVKKLSN